MRLIPVLALVLVGCATEQVVVGPNTSGDSVEYPWGSEQQGAAADLSDRPVTAFSFHPQSDVPVDAEGVVLAADGAIAHAGLGDVSCDIYTAFGTLGSDYYDSGDDTVVDVGVVGNRETWMTLTPGVVNLHPVNSGMTAGSYSVAGVEEARFAAGGFVTVARTTLGCVAGWYDFDGGVTGSVHFDGEACDGSLAVDRASGVAWLATPDGVLELAPGSVRSFHGAPDAHLAFDGEALFVGTADGRLRALDSDGIERWAVDLGAPIEALAADRHNGAVYAAVDSFQRRVVMLDREEATELGSLAYSSSARQIAVSSGGNRLAINTFGGVEFHDIVNNRP